MKTIEVKPPSRYMGPLETLKHTKVFLAGSIEQGNADDWQSKVIDSVPFNTTFLNPRRDSWDASWVQDLNNPQFYEQVTWELDMLESADIILMYFDPNTKSPISLLELGLCAGTRCNDMIVCCPDGFWRKGNVDIVCQRFGIPLFTSLETVIVELKNRIN